MVINTNMSAETAATNLQRSQSMLAKSLARLSSGSKLTSPADDAAGTAVSTRMESEVNRLKAITRCGMGRCQGRFCGLAAAELTAQTLGLPLEAVGRLRVQPPVKPLPLAITPAETAPAAAPDGTSAPA